MKKKYRVVLALLLLVALFIQLFPVSGRLKAADERAAGNVLGPGKYFYLDPTSADGDWREAGAKIFLYCRISQVPEVWRTLQMQPDGDLLKVKLPDDMEPMATGEFKLIRCNASINVDGGDSIWDDTFKWGQCPGSNDNLRWADCPEGSNTFKLTAYSAGSWVAGTWNGKDYGGETLYFINMDKANPLSGVRAKFSVNGASEVISFMTLENEFLSSYSVKIPENGEYDAVTFMDDSGAELGSMELLNGDYEPNTKNTYYYKRTSKENNEIVNGIDAYPAGTESIAGKKLYLDAMDFSVNYEEEIYMQIGEGTEATVTRDSTDTDVYSYTIPAGTSANQQTILTIRYKENRYRFMWNDINKNMVCLSGGVAGIVDTYTHTADGKRVIYFDATLSKLSYTGDVSESFAIPESGKKVWYRAWKSNDSTVRFGEMTLLQPRERNGNTYEDVWKAEIDSDLEYLSFFSGTSQNDWRVCPKATVTLNIPAENVYSNPCFYADAGDDSVYKGSARDGYWGEVYTIRDAESNKNNVVVDIPSNDTFTHQLLAYYVSATLYDYYTDYELNGNNRDSYETNTLEELSNSHRIYQPFRQFNMALSDYYRNVGAESQLYWGNFQHPSYGYGSSEFNGIANTLNLFGYNTDMVSDMFKKFFYQNNSMWDRNGVMLPDSNNATVGLVSSSLTDGNLMMKTDKNTTVFAPFFNAEFLQGKNSKNAVLGKVYEDVKFPFIQQTKSGLKDVNGNPAAGTVDYWYFNSADNTASNSRLRLKQDKNDGTYYLETEDAVKGTTTNGATDNDNYFPFNDGTQSGDAGKLNYGFGQKMELNFKLTPDGTVETTEDVKVPIEFTFSGDDDVWIFIDGQLVLDVGGGHGVVEGVIDFAKLQSSVSGVKNVTGGGRSQNVIQVFPDILKNDSNFYKKEHTLTMFYMERGLWESNLHITFNFPDESIFSVEKEVNTETVNNIFKDIFNQAAFPFNIKNQATHYGALPVGGTTGFGVSQADISEYGSVGSGKLENAAGAVYTLNNTDESLAVNSEGMFTLKDGERVDFVNQFRRGSYIYLKEEISQDNFSTRWELYDNDSKVTSTKVPASHVNTIGGKELTEDDMVGNVISDGRQESYIGNAGIANSGYTHTGPAKIGDEKRDTNDTIVFRSYSEPDGIVGLNLRVKEINTVRTGSVTIAKEQASGFPDLGETEFEFRITFTNISGMHFETAPIEQTIKLKKGASYTISGIPAGTEYKIEEIASEGYTLKEVKPTVGNDTDVLVTNGIVTGKVVADDTELAPTSFVFVNAKDVGSIDIIKKNSDNMIPGVEFTLYESDKSTIAKDSDGNVLQAVTNSAGKISFSNIPVGTQEVPKTYYLVETKAAKGYALMKEPIEVTLPYEYHAGDIVDGVEVTEDGITNHLTYTIFNDKVFLLPSSGQSGVGLYIMLGVVLTVTAGGGLFIRARQKGKQQ